MDLSLSPLPADELRLQCMAGGLGYTTRGQAVPVACWWHQGDQSLNNIDWDQITLNIGCKYQWNWIHLLPRVQAQGEWGDFDNTTLNKKDLKCNTSVLAMSAPVKHLAGRVLVVFESAGSDVS